MNERIRQAAATRRFKWGLIGTVASLVFLLSGIALSDSARERLDRIEQDPRFGDTAWNTLPADEQQRLGRELMSARNNLGQIRMGRVLFAITLTISLTLFIVSFVRIKSRVDAFIEDTENEEKRNGG